MSLAKICLGGFKDALVRDRTPTNIQDFMGGWLPLGTKNYNLKVFFLCNSFVGFKDYAKQNGYRGGVSKFSD
jgi:hypothetical protein